MSDDDERGIPDKYWSAVGDDQGVIWVGSEHRPNWRKRVVGGDRRKRVVAYAGSNHGSAKLTEADIPAIHLAYRNGEMASGLARRFGVSDSTIRDILSCKHWSHAWDGGPSTKPTRFTYSNRSKTGIAKLDDDKIRKIRQLSRAGMNQIKIAAMFGIDRTNVSCILTGKTWRHVRDFDDTPLRLGRSKLDAEMVLAIRARAKSGEAYLSIAKQFSVSASTISRIMCRKGWTHVPDEPPSG